MDLHDLYVKDVSCNSLQNPYTTDPILKASYVGEAGDSNMCFDIDYNMVYSPWSNPSFPMTQYDSLTVELTGRESDGSLNVNIFFTNMTLASPSKPQFLKVSKEMNSNPSYSFYPRLTWLRNKEPDMSTYGIYKASTNTPGVDGDYVYIASTSDTTYLDQTILMYDPTAHYNGACPPQPVCYSYRITAVDVTAKESCLSDRDSISGYIDPCESEEIGPDYQSIEEAGYLKNELMQNFPNPFNPKTLIEYQIQKDEFIVLKVFDISGKEILILVDEFKPKGRYHIELNGTNFASGIYFYQLKAGKYITARRMIILK